MPKANQAGYTLIELLVVTGLLAVLIVGAASLFVNTLTHKLRLTMNQEIKQEGEYLIDQISFFVRNAKNISTPCDGTDQSSLSLQNLDGGSTVFAIVEESGIARVASTSATYVAHLSSQEYQVDELTFNCQTNPNNRPYVTISLSLTRSATAVDPVTRDFQHTVLMRNPSAQ